MRNLVIAGSLGQFKYHLRDKIEAGEIEPHERNRYRFISEPLDLMGVHPADTKIHYWGDYMRNKLMRSRELYVFNQRARDAQEKT